MVNNMYRISFMPPVSSLSESQCRVTMYFVITFWTWHLNYSTIHVVIFKASALSAYAYSSNKPARIYNSKSTRLVKASYQTYKRPNELRVLIACETNRVDFTLWIV